VFQKLKIVARDLKRDLRVYQMALRDPRTPKLAKVLLGLAIGYALSPIDLIPDFIPIIGHLDDVIIIPVLIRIALKMIPDEVIDDCRLRVSSGARSVRPRRQTRPR
jgi:uncharacterized membrane protein YkvA (DUF1232 family)